MAYKVIILYRLYMPFYFLGTFTEYPFLLSLLTSCCILNQSSKLSLKYMYIYMGKSKL